MEPFGGARGQVIHSEGAMSFETRLQNYLRLADVLVATIKITELYFFPHGSDQMRLIDWLIDLIWQYLVGLLDFYLYLIELAYCLTDWLIINL